MEAPTYAPSNLRRFQGKTFGHDTHPSQAVSLRQSIFTETQIVSILQEPDADRPVNEIWWSDGINSITYYKWTAPYGGVEASDIKRLKELEEKYRKLNRLYVDMHWRMPQGTMASRKKNSTACCVAGGRPRTQRCVSRGFYARYPVRRSMVPDVECAG